MNPLDDEWQEDEQSTRADDPAAPPPEDEPDLPVGEPPAPADEGPDLSVLDATGEELGQVSDDAIEDAPAPAADEPQLPDFTTDNAVGFEGELPSAENLDQPLPDFAPMAAAARELGRISDKAIPQPPKFDEQKARDIEQFHAEQGQQPEAQGGQDQIQAAAESAVRNMESVASWIIDLNRRLEAVERRLESER